MKKKVEFGSMEVTDAGEKKEGVVSINIGSSYLFEPDDFIINVQHTQYANNSYMQVMGQDIFIDFMALPGVKRDGKMVTDATRIYMTHIQAKKLADALNRILESSHTAGKMESYPPKK